MLFQYWKSTNQDGLTINNWTNKYQKDDNVIVMLDNFFLTTIHQKDDF